MNLGPFARILLRYGIGFLAGSQIGEQLAMDQDIVTAVAMAMGVAVEAFYVLAKKKGWAT
jgi:hypothetical protein